MGMTHFLAAARLQILETKSEAKTVESMPIAHDGKTIYQGTARFKYLQKNKQKWK